MTRTYAFLSQMLAILNGQITLSDFFKMADNINVLLFLLALSLIILCPLAFTALVQADAWYTQNVENRKEPK